MADTSKVEIKIQTTADTAGAKAAASALDQVKVSTEKGGVAAKDTGKNVNQLGESYEKGAAAGRVLSSALQGNITSLGQLGAVLKAVGASLLANPLLTLGAVAAAVILPALQSIVAGWQEVEDQQKKAAVTAGEASAAAIEALSKKRENALAEAFAEVAARAAEARAQIDAVTAAQIAQTDAEEAVAVARINADPTLSNVQRVEQTAAARGSARDRRNQIQLGALDAQDQVAATSTAGAARAAEEARRREASAGQLLGSVAGRSPAAIQKELSALQAQAGVVDPNKSLAELAADIQRRADLEQELADAQAQYAPRLKAAQDNLAAATEARAKAEDEAAKLAAAQAAQLSINQAKRAAIAATAGGQAAVAALEQPAAIAAAAAKDAEASATAANLADLGGKAGRFGSGARNVALGAQAAGDTGLQAAAKAVADAAQAAQTDGTTKEEVQALITAATQLATELKARKKESDSLAAAIRIVTEQLKNGRTQ